LAAVHEKEWRMARLPNSPRRLAVINGWGKNALDKIVVNDFVGLLGDLTALT
jgi:hypothetical protein